MTVMTRNLWIGPMACALLGFGVLIYLVHQAPLGAAQLLVAPAGGYRITAKFDNVADLRVGSPLTIAGVKIGLVDSIRYESHAAKAVVTLRISSSSVQLPRDSDAVIHSQSLLGGKRIEIVAGGSDDYLTDGGEIVTTKSAMALETLINKTLEAVANRKSQGPPATPQAGS